MKIVCVVFVEVISLTIIGWMGCAMRCRVAAFHPFGFNLTSGANNKHETRSNACTSRTRLLIWVACWDFLEKRSLPTCGKRPVEDHSLDMQLREEP